MSSRRSRGDGSVYFDAGRGCWVGSVDIGRNPETGRRVRRKVSGATRTEVKEKLAELGLALKDSPLDFVTDDGYYGDDEADFSDDEQY